jgi:hypothetical protein
MILRNFSAEISHFPQHFWGVKFSTELSLKISADKNVRQIGPTDEEN